MPMVGELRRVWMKLTRKDRGPQRPFPYHYQFEPPPPLTLDSMDADFEGFDVGKVLSGWPLGSFQATTFVLLSTWGDTVLNWYSKRSGVYFSSRKNYKTKSNNTNAFFVVVIRWKTIFSANTIKYPMFYLKNKIWNLFEGVLFRYLKNGVDMQLRPIRILPPIKALINPGMFINLGNVINELPSAPLTRPTRIL